MPISDEAEDKRKDFTPTENQSRKEIEGQVKKQ